MKKVYLDSAATTQMREEVIVRMSSVMRENYGNPSSTHSYGRSSKSLIEQARKTVASYLNVQASEIVFTSGGTEADNLVLNSAVRDLGVKRIVTSRIEHHAVLHTVEQLQKNYNIQVDYVKLDENGAIVLEDLERLLSSSEGKTLVSLMHVNNEIGNKIDLKHVAEICKNHAALFHSDTVQSVGHYELDFKEIPVDFTAASAHKFHGPKGVGFAFIRKNSGLKPLIFGGEQERGHRAGTESVHNIVGLEESLKLSYKNLQQEKDYVSGLKSYFINSLQEKIPGVKFNGNCAEPEKSTYTLINVCLPVSAEKALMLLFQLDLKGISCSKGSACQSGSDKGSHVLSAFLSEEDLAKPSIRFSLSVFNTKEEIDYVVAALKEFIES
ncbi:cysteine desulfurase family protein [Zunongwangia sp. F363]|uniref:Cysteine desulfurase family protein n=1 Tax=Autumnicola tepida TaxID=3075595 RepID=A0ABU3CEK7_9FLAO|nr:cysteine desulfurase family protein [Zunongwangia sp. F363]MDT0644784.1 cysteine desulfurase family protein [Zunongwangia sp. F363]